MNSCMTLKSIRNFFVNVLLTLNTVPGWFESGTVNMQWNQITRCIRFFHHSRYPDRHSVSLIFHVALDARKASKNWSTWVSELGLSNHVVNKQFAHILSNALRIKIVFELSKLVLLLFAALTCNCHWKQGWINGCPSRVRVGSDNDEKVNQAFG